MSEKFSMVKLLRWLYKKYRARMSDLKKELFFDKCEDSFSQNEWLLVVNSFFSSSALKGDELLFCRNGKEVIKLSFSSRKGVLEKIALENGTKIELIDELKEHIEKSMFENQSSCLYQEIIFGTTQDCMVPFRYKDVFQVSLCPTYATKPKYSNAEHPLVLQYEYTDSENSLLASFRRSHKVNELGLLLCLFTGGSITLNNDTGHCWVLVTKENPLSVNSEYCQKGYWSSGISSPINEFTNYPNQDLIIRTSHSHHAQYFEIFDKLDSEGKNKLLRAAFWLHHARKIESISRSATFTAIITAIETISSNMKVDVDECKKCGKKDNKPTKQFHEFVEKYAEIEKKDRNELYSIRSGVVHGSHLLETDTNHFLWGINHMESKQRDKLTFVYSVAYNSLINWMIDAGR